jgi:phosphate transport system protein
VEGDLVLADVVAADDDAIDALRHAIEDECLYLLGRPLSPPDLRFVGTAMRVAQELERSADLMVNVSRTAWRVFPHPLTDEARRIIDRMGRQVVVQLRVAVNAFTDRDPSWAAALDDMDETVDELEALLVRGALERHRGAGGDDSEATVLHAVQLALVGRHFERIGDHAVTIARQVRYVVSGERATRRRTRTP